MLTRLERYFGFAAHETTWRTEILAGLTTFITMAYIIFVNPAILSQTGMPLAAVTTSTCLCAAIGSILMGALANYPLALAPGMGLNAYFTYTVVKGMGVPWQTALGAVFHLRRYLPAVDLRRHPAEAAGRDSASTALGGGGRHRTVHRVHRPAELGHHRSQPGDHGDPGQPARAHHATRDLRHRADRGAAGLPRQGVDADRRAGHAGGRDPAAPGQVHAVDLQPDGDPRYGLSSGHSRRAAG